MTSEERDLCSLVKEVRVKLGDSQESFAHRILVASATVSRFERCVQSPRDPKILENLKNAAILARVDAERITLVMRALDRAKGSDSTTFTVPTAQLRTRTLSEWRLQSAALIAAKYHPEEAIAIEKAASQSMQIVDSVLRETETADQIDDAFYEDLDRRLSDLAEKRLLQRFREKRK
jgi:hypothetical protein